LEGTLVTAVMLIVIVLWIGILLAIMSLPLILGLSVWASIPLLLVAILVKERWDKAHERVGPHAATTERKIMSSDPHA
jgi:hypothetical protein